MLIADNFFYFPNRLYQNPFPEVPVSSFSWFGWKPMLLLSIFFFQEHGAKTYNPVQEDLEVPCLACTA
jgi:hypothetical protein